jgi:hypothetical protein
LRWAIEGVVLLLVCLSPWAFGAVEPWFLFLLDSGVAVLAALWAAVLLVEGRLSLNWCPVTLCLAALVLLGICQLVPWPAGTLPWLSAGTARLYERLLPARPEVLPLGGSLAAPSPSAGTTITLYPAATEREVVKLIGVLLLFSVVRQQLRSVAAAQRLAVFATANGAVLAVFALVQFFAAPPNTLYWRFKPEGSVFGPFICRNHFPFYVNMCLGLGVGLLLAICLPGRAMEPRGFHASGRKSQQRMASPSRPGSRQPSLLTRWLQNPQAPWVSFAVVMMVTAVVVSLSRGGLLALVGAGLACLVLVVWRGSAFSSLAAAGLVTVPALALVTWFGPERVNQRLGTVWEGNAFSEDRFELWARLFRNASEFPLWGTGYGTLNDVEPLSRTTGQDAGWVWEYAHNDYLEALVEGGALRLAISLLAIVLVLRLGFRAFRRDDLHPANWLALGGLVGFLTLLIHSTCDFGLHIPAITILATVLAAYLCNLGDAAPNIPPGQSPTFNSFRLGGLAPYLAAAVLIVLGLTLFVQGWRQDHVSRYLTAGSLLRRGARPGDETLAREYLETAAKLQPENGRAHDLLAQTCLEQYAERSTQLANRVVVSDGMALLLAGSPTDCTSGAVPARLTILSAALSGAEVRQRYFDQQSELLNHVELLPGLQHLVAARDRCPLRAEVQLRLALNRDRFESAEPRAAYLERAKYLAPGDPDIWYVCGVQELFDGETRQAWSSWRRSLELSDLRREDILRALSTRQDLARVLEQVLPDKPALWLAAAQRLYPASKTAEQRPLLERALRLFEGSKPLTAEELHSRAVVNSLLGRPALAGADFQAALEEEPGRVAWHLEFARFLREQRRLPEARRELLLILADEPEQGEARQLLAEVEQALAAGPPSLPQPGKPESDSAP